MPGEEALAEYGQNLPYSLEAEQSVLGAILIDPEKLPEVMNVIRTPSAFYTRQHQELYALMIQMFSESKPIDYVTLLEESQRAEVFENSQNAKTYLLHLMELVPTTANLSRYCDIVVEKYYLRNLLTAATDIASSVREADGDASTLLDAAEQKIYDIRQGRQSADLKPISEVIIGVYDEIYQMNSKTDSRYTGIPSGFTGLDALLSGLNKSDLILVAARPGMGKSSFALNIAANVALKNDVEVAVFSLEMSNPQLVSRMLSSDASITSDKLRTGHLDAEEWSRLAISAQRLSATQIYFDDSAGITVSQIKAKLRRLKKLGLVIIDYRVQEVSMITRNLKVMAKELNVPVICLSQLSRAAEQRQGHRPMLSDLRESGSIEQDADSVLFLFREAYYNEENQDQPANENLATCIVAKNRHGSTGDVTIGWQGEFTRFSNAELYRDEP